MKFFRMLNIPVMLLGFGAAMILAPACKAQSEVAPDHFDGSEPWAASQPVPQKVSPAKSRQTPSASQARTQQTNSPATLQLASKRDSSAPAQPASGAIDDKRKASARKPKKP
jgi:hypothetical protein